MAKPNDVTPAEKLIEVRLLKNYVPANPELKDERIPGVFVKHLVGEMLKLPKAEAKRALELGVAERIIGDDD